MEVWHLWFSYCSETCIVGGFLYSIFSVLLLVKRASCSTFSQKSYNNDFQQKSRTSRIFFLIFSSNFENHPMVYSESSGVDRWKWFEIPWYPKSFEIPLKSLYDYVHWDSQAGIWVGKCIGETGMGVQVSTKSSDILCAIMLNQECSLRKFSLPNPKLGYCDSISQPSDLKIVTFQIKIVLLCCLKSTLTLSS